MNDIGFYGLNSKDNGTLTAVRIFARRYSVLLGYIACTVSGIAVGLVFNTVSSFSYVSTVSDLLIHATNITGDTAFDIIGSLLLRSRVDISFLLYLLISGLTYICRTAASAVLLYRGFLLGVTVSGCAQISATTAQNQSESFLIIVTATLTTTVLVMYAVIADCTSASFSYSHKDHNPSSDIKRLFSYALSSLTCAGALILIHIATWLITGSPIIH